MLSDSERRRYRWELSAEEWESLPTGAREAIEWVDELDGDLAEARDIISVLVSSHPLNPDNALRRLDSEVVSRQVLGRASGWLTRPSTTPKSEG
jgi:hypothetical protein